MIWGEMSSVKNVIKSKAAVAFFILIKIWFSFKLLREFEKQINK